MKLIEALKKAKDLARKHADIVQKISQYCADMDFEQPVYPDQKGQITAWLQSCADISQEIGKLKYQIQVTNVQTKVPIVIGDNTITKSIAEWIVRRKELAGYDSTAWQALTNRNLKAGRVQQTSGAPLDVKPRLYFDPVLRDKKVEEFRSEPSLIDARLEVINATTDLIVES